MTARWDLAGFGCGSRLRKRCRPLGYTDQQSEKKFGTANLCIAKFYFDFCLHFKSRLLATVRVRLRIAKKKTNYKWKQKS